MNCDRPMNDWNRWYVLLDSRVHHTNEARMDGDMLLREKAMVSPSKRRYRAPGKPPSKWDDEGNPRFFEKQEGQRGDSRDRDRSASNSRGRSNGGAKVLTHSQPTSSTKPHNDWSNVPDYYKAEPPKRHVPLSLTSSPGVPSCNSSLSSLTTISSVSTLSSKTMDIKRPNHKEEAEICKLFALGNCILGSSCNYRQSCAKRKS